MKDRDEKTRHRQVQFFYSSSQRKPSKIAKEIPILLEKTLEIGTRENNYRNFCKFY